MNPRLNLLLNQVNWVKIFLCYFSRQLSDIFDLGFGCTDSKEEGSEQSSELTHQWFYQQIGSSMIFHMTNLGEIDRSAYFFWLILKDLNSICWHCPRCQIATEGVALALQGEPEGEISFAWIYLVLDHQIYSLNVARENCCV